MLVNDLTGQLARERVADLHRQAERQRLVRLARTQRRGGNRGIWPGRRLLVGWLRGSSTAPSAARPSATP
jgi:hypothetical protein